MHEMSIALSIIDAVTARAKEEQARKVSAIELEIGKISGVETESLKFCFSAAAKNTIAEGAELAVREIEPVAECEKCGKRFPVDFYYAQCSACGSLDITLVSGKELSIKSMTLM